MKSPGRRGFVNITRTVEDLVRKSGVREGLGLVNAMHITASLFIDANKQPRAKRVVVYCQKRTTFPVRPRGVGASRLMAAWETKPHLFG